MVAPSLRGGPYGQDVAELLEHLGIAQVERLYAYSVGASVATRLFGRIGIERGVLLAGGVAPFGTALAGSAAGDWVAKWRGNGRVAAWRSWRVMRLC